MNHPAHLRSVLRDALAMWGIQGRVTIEGNHVVIARPDGAYRVSASGQDAARWLLQTPAREAAGRPPRPAPSITALLTALRAALGVPRGGTARIGPGAA
ncbi:MAG: hypothetical protein IT555_13595 [Acetobacteraceae bacterium]|nr:hypothetical protein [Acetobacteraceae bacterium]